MIASKPYLPKSALSAFAGSSLIFALILLTSHTLGKSAYGQDLQSRSVARLITAEAISHYSGPPGTTVKESLSGTNASTASLSIDRATSIERRAFDRTNEARVQHGILPLLWDADLCRMARVHSQDMARLGFFSHETPAGSRLKDRARTAGVLHFRLLAENIAYNQAYEDPGAFAVEQWMLSPGHRANILDSGLQASAIGSFVSADGGVYLTQVFVTR